MTKYERFQVTEANKRPTPPKGYIVNEDEHSKREGEYERRMVTAALKSISEKQE